MDELTLIQIRSDSFAQVWSSLQWWASISFGLIALCAFKRERLNLAVTAGLTVLYTVFSIYTLLNVGSMMTNVVGAMAELSALRDAGQIGYIGTQVIGYAEGPGGLNGTVFLVCFVATYGGSLAYLWYSHRSAANSKVWRYQSLQEFE